LAEDTSLLNPIQLATELTIAWLGNPNTRASSDEVPAFLNRMHQAVVGLSHSPEVSDSEPAQEFTPATTVRRSLASKDHIISLIDGKPYKTLRRHLATHGLTPEQYRERYNLKPNYPMVAPTYSDSRRAMAQKIGLGRKSPTATGTADEKESASQGATRRVRRTSASAAAPDDVSFSVQSPARRGRKPKEAPQG
jgi:predicted transcriptional regulator